MPADRSNQPAFYSRAQRPSPHAPVRGARRAIACGAMLAWLMGTVASQPAAAQIQLPQPGIHRAITIGADSAHRWKQGAYDVWLLSGNCHINQGQTYARSQQAVLWIEHAEAYGKVPTKVIAYLEGGVALDFPPAEGSTTAHRGTLRDSQWFGRFFTTASLNLRVPPPAGEPPRPPPIFERGLARFSPGVQGKVQRAQFTEFGSGPALSDPLPRGVRRIRAFPRSDVRVQAQWFPSGSGNQWVAVITAGVNLIIDGESDGRSLDVAADRMVIWTTGVQADLTGQTLQRDDTPLEIYMEGNIVFREGDRLIQADRMYYDATKKVGVVLRAELLTPVPDYEGMLRLKASVLRQLDQDLFVAHDGILTTSRLGEPRYSLGAGTITFRDTQEPVIHPLTGEPVVDPETGEPVIAHERLAQSRNNFLYLAGVPVFYWPTLATDLEDPRFYVKSATLRNDQIFGTQVLLGLDAYQLFGIRRPLPGTDWNIDLDYLSDRGFGSGTNFKYGIPDFFGIGGQMRGVFDIWGLNDKGLDNLGADRRAVPPEENFRGRAFWQHRHHLDRGFTLTAQLGLISDNNFLEQYFEQEWDQWKDQNTGLELKRIVDNTSWDIFIQGRLINNFTETEWYPRGDHFWLGESLWNDRLTWFEHSNASYARMRVAGVPTNPVDAAKFTVLPWEANVKGERIATRQEIDLPFELGPVKVVGYALGELAHWGQALDGEPLDRAYGQLGARASLPFWSANPNVENQLFNVHGMAHKVTFDTEFSYSDSNRDVTELPLYDPINDNAQEQFERRIQFNTYGLMAGDPVPAMYDPRFYAIRSGLGGWVSSPSTEVVDDLTVIRTGMHHRWQTKRGRPGERRIIDWIVLDANASWFPKADDENFGEAVGLIDYDFRWHVGDRVTLVSDGYFDVFSQGLKVVTLGGYLNRPDRGRMYLGFRSIEGPVSSNVAIARFNYQMSPKWFATVGSSIDFSTAGNVGQRFSITRVGESLLVRAGFVYNESKDVFGVTLMVEPRFLPRSQRGRNVGVRVPPAGAFGLE